MNPNSDTETTHHLASSYLLSVPSTSIELRSFPWAWTSPSLRLSHRHIPHPLLPLTIHDEHPKQAAWRAFASDYAPSDKPSLAACTIPQNPTPPPAILGAISTHNRLAFSTILHLITGHCFDADYSKRFRAGANNPTTCPCSHTPLQQTQPRLNPLCCSPRVYCHTKNHVLFRCRLTREAHTTHLRGITSLTAVFQSEDLTHRLGSFLLETNSSLLRPLPVLCPGRDPTPSE